MTPTERAAIETRARKVLADPRSEAGQSLHDFATACLALLDALAAAEAWAADLERQTNEALDLGERMAARLLEAAERLAEVEATLANERGEGPPPREGWTYDGGIDGWVHERGGSTLATVERYGSSTGGGAYWTIATPDDVTRAARYPTARDAMRAADAAIEEINAGLGVLCG